MEHKDYSFSHGVTSKVSMDARTPKDFPSTREWISAVLSVVPESVLRGVGDGKIAYPALIEPEPFEDDGFGLPEDPEEINRVDYAAVRLCQAYYNMVAGLITTYCEERLSSETKEMMAEVKRRIHREVSMQAYDGLWLDGMQVDYIKPVISLKTNHLNLEY